MWRGVAPTSRHNRHVRPNRKLCVEGRVVQRRLWRVVVWIDVINKLFIKINEIYQLRSKLRDAGFFFEVVDRATGVFAWPYLHKITASPVWSPVPPQISFRLQNICLCNVVESFHSVPIGPRWWGMFSSKSTTGVLLNMTNDINNTNVSSKTTAKPPIQLRTGRKQLEWC